MSDVWKVLLGTGFGILVTAIGAVLNDHYKLLKVEKDTNNIGGKTSRLEMEMINDRMVDIACTMELYMRLWKCDQFRKEFKR